MFFLELVFGIIDEVMVYKDKIVKINFKFRFEYKKLMSIFDIHEEK